MSKKKKKSSAAENLIESLMDDLKDIHEESSYKPQFQDEEFAGLPTFDADENRVENANVSNSLWIGLENSIEKGLDRDLESSEFSGGADDEDSDVDSESSGAFEVPVGFSESPSSESFDGPSADEEPYGGPSADGDYKSSNVLSNEPSNETFFPQSPDKTVSVQDMNATSPVLGTAADRTIAVEGFANARIGARKSQNVDVKVSIGNHRGSRGAANVLTSVDASLAQAENLKLAQQRILELEKEVEYLRVENEELASAGEIIRSRTDDLGIRITALEKEKVEIQESAQSEMLVLKGNLQYKENEVAKARIKVEELETRLKSDFKKIRVRERELENRLELLRAEKSAIVRSKDEYILEQKRKIDQLSQELDNYRRKCLELNKTIEANQDQVKRTERALRLALTNLEAKEENNVPLKKAE